MAWVESHQELGTHPKTRKAARLAGVSVPTMVGHLHLIWHYALDFAQEGDVTHLEPWQIESAAMWAGEEGKLHSSLVDAGYIDVASDGNRSLHDWYDYAGKLIERRLQDADRKRRSRTDGGRPSGPRPKEPRTPSGGRPPDVQKTADGSGTESVESPSVTLTLTVPSSSPNGELGAEAPTDQSGPSEKVTEEPTDQPADAPEAPWEPTGPDQTLVKWWADHTGYPVPAMFGAAVGAAAKLRKAGLKPHEAEDLYRFCSDIFPDEAVVTLQKMTGRYDEWRNSKLPKRSPAPPKPKPADRAPMVTTEQEMDEARREFFAGSRALP